LGGKGGRNFRFVIKKQTTLLRKEYMTRPNREKDLKEKAEQQVLDGQKQCQERKESGPIAGGFPSIYQGGGSFRIEREKKSHMGKRRS